MTSLGVGQPRDARSPRPRVWVRFVSAFGQQVTVIERRGGASGIRVALGVQLAFGNHRIEVPDHLATTTVATLLPMVLQVEMAIDMNR